MLLFPGGLETVLGDSQYRVGNVCCFCLLLLLIGGETTLQGCKSGVGPRRVSAVFPIGMFQLSPVADDVVECEIYRRARSTRGVEFVAKGIGGDTEVYCGVANS